MRAPNEASNTSALIAQPITLQGLLQAALGRPPSEAELLAAAQRLSSAEGRDWLLDAQLPGAAAAPLFVPPGHFYSPIVDPTEAARFLQFDRSPASLDIPGVRLDMEQMVETWADMQPWLQNHPFPERRDPRQRYYFENPFYSYGDALILRAMLLRHRPSRVVTVGAGFSSAAILDTLLDEAEHEADITLIDPFPDVIRQLMLPGDQRNVTLLSEPVQGIDQSVFATLGHDDLLFIDSTHIVRTGSDVWFLFREVLPRLARGVIVHVHDIFWPFEYPPDWTLRENRSWNEAYVLRALLTDTDAWEILFWNDAWLLHAPERIQRDCPQFLRNSGGGFWMRRIG